MKRLLTLHACLLVGLLTAAIGCVGGEEPAATPKAKAPGATAGAAEPDQPATADPGAKPPGPRVARYRPPFPQRTNLFAPKQRARAVRTGDRETGGAVELKGFADVGEPKAILAIDGRLIPVSAGDVQFGVQVISIQPPEVLLQRGRSRWTATLQ
ncbi:MAG: hypothetical protein AAGB00_03595 [Planctomycetota bacterium]